MQWQIHYLLNFQRQQRNLNQCYLECLLLEIFLESKCSKTKVYRTYSLNQQVDTNVMLEHPILSQNFDICVTVGKTTKKYFGKLTLESVCKSTIFGNASTNIRFARSIRVCRNFDINTRIKITALYFLQKKIRNLDTKSINFQHDSTKQLRFSEFKF